MGHQGLDLKESKGGGFPHKFLKKKVFPKQVLDHPVTILLFLVGLGGEADGNQGSPETLKGGVKWGHEVLSSHQENVQKPT